MVGDPLAGLRAISFDMDGTLVKPHFSEEFWNETIPELYAESKKMAYEEAKEYVLRAYDSVGDLDMRWYLPSYWLERFGLRTDAKELMAILTKESERKPTLFRGGLARLYI